MTRAGARLPGPKLWHFTCEHSRAEIGDVGLLRPWPHPLLPILSSVVWLTTDPDPAPFDVGLELGELITCDRMAYRYQVLDTRTAIDWAQVRHLDDPRATHRLEDGRPWRTWKVSTEPVKVRLSNRAKSRPSA